MHIRRSITATLALITLTTNSVALASDGPPTRAPSSAKPLLHPVTDNHRGKPLSKRPAKATPQQLHPEAAPTKLRAPFVEQFLVDGNLAAGENALADKLKMHPKSDQLRVELGFLRFLRAVEHLSQDLYRFGLRDRVTDGLTGPIGQLPIPRNPNPETLTYTDARKIAAAFSQNLAQTEATLAPVSDSKVKLPLHFGLIKLDINGDGRSDNDESLWHLYSTVSRSRDVTEKNATNFSITFDRGDVHWLRGYCHLLMSLCEIYLAHDTKESFDCTAHLLFTKVDSPYPFLNKGKHVHSIGSEDVDILDLISFIHLIRWDVVEPARMGSALHHLEAVTEQSDETWKWIMAEADDDHEWLPNPSQTGVLPNVRVTEEMVTTWGDLMEQSKKVLAGKLLIPFWRGDDKRGVNLRRAFLEPRTLDLVLWVQGPAAGPYLEEGPKTESLTWRRLNSTFSNNFPGFAIYFN